MTLSFPNELPPGARVWVCARWSSRRGDFSPLSEPLDAHLPGDARTSVRQVQSAAAV